MIKHLAATILGVVTTFGAVPVQADYIVYTNRVTFEAAIAGEQTESFNQIPGGIRDFGPTGLNSSNGLSQPLQITGSNNFLLSATASAFAGYYPSNGTYLIGPISNSLTDGIRVTLPANTYSAAGADAAVFTVNSIVSFQVKTSLGETLRGSIAVDASSPNSVLGFLGVILTAPGDTVTSLTFSAPVGANQNVMLDNISFGFAPTVPEPRSMVLLATGTLALGFVTLRKRVAKKLV